MKVAGFGFRKSVEIESLRDALCQASGGSDITVFATAADKAVDPALVALSQDYGVRVHAVPPHRLSEVKTITNSAASQAARQSGSVAEAAALAVAGPGAELVQSRVVSTDRKATCAIAVAPRKDGQIGENT